MVRVTGPAGIGKTRLVRETVRAAERRGIRAMARPLGLRGHIDWVEAMT